MYVLIDQSDLVAHGFSSGLEREGVPLASFRPEDFGGWLASASNDDVQTVEAFVLGNCDPPEAFPKLIRRHSSAPVIALSEQPSLERTLALFDAGADDVVRKPVHMRELLARVEAVRRRARPETEAATLGRMRVFRDGRSPEVDGQVLDLPRRERRILEVLVANRGKWLSKAQVFSATYGLFDERVQETVVESHVSKLRRKLALALDQDPIEARRYLGYRVA